MSRFALTLLLILAARPAEAGRYLSAIAVAVGSTAGTPKPAPAPSPSGQCDNCNGTGKLGDGTVFVPCPVCGGDGVKGNKPAAPAQPAALHSSPSPPAIGHPAATATVLSQKPLKVVKQPGPMWLQNGHSATVDHLVNAHGIDRATASRMTESQRNIAHSNAHNAARAATSSGCPGGVCPSSSRSRGFRLFRR